MMKKNVVIIGAGLAGLSAALTLAEKNVHVLLVSGQPSERAQSVMAEGGINAAMNTKGEGDTAGEHAQETLRSAAGLADEQAVREMTDAAPEIVHWLTDLGVCFNRTASGQLDLRNFGGQKKKRTVFAQNQTGKQIMTALIDAVRRQEAEGLVERYPHHHFSHLTGTEYCTGCVVTDTYTGRQMALSADAVILACGGMHGLFKNTTGSLFNTGEAAAALFSQGVEMANLEMIQYHPTTVHMNGKRMLITEAARGEGGRLYSQNGKEKSYFMEERYPELGNLMPRDVTAREIEKERASGRTVFLDMTGLDAAVWNGKLQELRRDLTFYLGLDPAEKPFPVEPGIHYFMGGIRVDRLHRTNICGLYAAGECACIYHGANRLGGNSLLGAVYGGRTAAESVLSESRADAGNQILQWNPEYEEYHNEEACRIMQSVMGIVREEKVLQKAEEDLKEFSDPVGRFCRAIVKSALERRESRGAHYRNDYPKADTEYEKVSYVRWNRNGICYGFAEAGGKVL